MPRAAPAVPIDSAAEFTRELMARATEEQRVAYRRYFPADDSFAGVRMGEVFELAKRALALPVADVEALLESPVHEIRAGACSVMGKAATHRRTTIERRHELYDLYLRRHDRIDDWDLVDLAAAQVLGTWLLDKPRTPLHELALSPRWPERRSAIVATAAFIRGGETAETFAIAALLLDDAHDLVQKGAGWMLRYAGDVDRPGLVAFLDTHAPAMPRPMLRAASEKFDRGARSDLLARR